MTVSILLSFIPIFVAVDAIGTLPIFIGLTQELNPQQKKKVIIQSFWTALCLALGFLFLSKAVFKLLGVTVSDFMIAGGAILFCIAMMDLLAPGEPRHLSPEQMGAVPIGTPLIVGPAVLTTSLALLGQYGFLVVGTSLFLNILLAALCFVWSDGLIKILGQNGTRALSKILSLLLAAIAVKMIRMGIVQLIAS